MDTTRVAILAFGLALAGAAPAQHLGEVICKADAAFVGTFVGHEVGGRVPRPEARRAWQIFDFCELPFPDSRNTAFHAKLASVGRVHHQNRYAEFDVIEQICLEEMRRMGYDIPSHTTADDAPREAVVAT